jgi:DNA-directed RNA polymerase subunit omega
MRDDYFKEALEIVDDPYVLVNMIWERMQMLRRGNHPLVESIGKVPLEDIALREIIEGRITYVLGNVVVPESLGAQMRAGDSRTDTPASPLTGAPFGAVASM